MNSDFSVNAAKDVFERSFLQKSLDLQVSHCDHYELLPWFKKWLPEHQPILEAGCGSGRWVVWFLKQGWEAVGLDWSENLIVRARSEVLNARFEVGDMRNMPFNDNEFGSIVSLGAIEHTIEGPKQSLLEYFRVLRPEGIAIITIPFLGPARRVSRLLKPVSYKIRDSNSIRKILGKPMVDSNSFRKIKDMTLTGYAADLTVRDGKWSFYQYQFTKKQMRTFLELSGFTIEEEFVEFGDQGILHNFKKLSGKYNYNNARVEFTFLGKILRRMIPVSQMGHMLCYVVRASK